MPAVIVETSGAVRRIRLNRPDKLNALNDDVRRELTEAFEALRDDISVRVAVIDGAGRCFSAGADLVGGAIAATPERSGGTKSSTWSQRRHTFGGWQRLLELIESVPQVTVASIRSHCIGGAALLAASCDLRIAADDVAVRIPELAIGIPLTWSGVPRLVREVGLPVARDLVMTGRTLDAREALHCGFVQRVCRPDELEKATDGLVQELLDMPPGPLAITRSMFAAISRDAMGAAGWADADLLSWSGREPESREAAADYAKRLGAKRPKDS
ncbi:MAG: enoyl-CoA hydratase/isomerase family protein [Actinomycetota bacterium]